MAKATTNNSEMIQIGPNPRLILTQTTPITSGKSATHLSSPCTGCFSKSHFARHNARIVQSTYEGASQRDAIVTWRTCQGNQRRRLDGGGKRAEPSSTKRVRKNKHLCKPRNLNLCRQRSNFQNFKVGEILLVRVRTNSRPRAVSIECKLLTLRRATNVCNTKLYTLLNDHMNFKDISFDGGAKITLSDAKT